jgi:hypothetical protein
MVKLEKNMGVKKRDGTGSVCGWGCLSASLDVDQITALKSCKGRAAPPLPPEESKSQNTHLTIPSPFASANFTPVCCDRYYYESLGNKRYLRYLENYCSYDNETEIPISSSGPKPSFPTEKLDIFPIPPAWFNENHHFRVFRHVPL